MSFPAGRQRCVTLAVVAFSLALAMSALSAAQAAPFGAPHPTGGALSQPGLAAWIFAQQASFYRSLSGFIRASKDDGSAMWSLFGISFLTASFMLSARATARP